jgi:hypothetical protein
MEKPKPGANHDEFKETMRKALEVAKKYPLKITEPKEINDGSI